MTPMKRILLLGALIQSAIPAASGHYTDNQWQKPKPTKKRAKIKAARKQRRGQK